jgi:shikimate dehydrogenase
VRSRQLCATLVPAERSGALSAASVQAQRVALGALRARHFHLFGSPISASPSPLMHNSGFQALALPHVYSLVDTLAVDECVAVIKSADFGGASVTIPHKEAIIPHLDALSPAARAIGAVNTVVVAADGALHGDNTDYLGIFNPLLAALGPAYPLRARASGAGAPCALVVGAGGTARAACYCVQQLGLALLVWNRTPAKAAALAAEFGGVALRDAATLDSVVELRCVISTVPAVAGWTLPASLLAQRPAVVEVVYKPRVTALVTQARGGGCAVVQGECSFIYRYILRESCSQFDSLPLTSLRRRARDRHAHRAGEFYMYRYILRESCSQFDSLPLTYFLASRRASSNSSAGPDDGRRPRWKRRCAPCRSRRSGATPQSSTSPERREAEVVYVPMPTYSTR